MGGPAGASRRAVAGWIVYDLANTIFSFNVLSLYYPLWLHTDQGLPDSVFAIGNTVAMAVVFVAAPLLGALSDRARRRIPFLVASTLACVLPTFALGFVPWTASIAFFVLANVGFQAGLVFYDALLPVVSTPATRGRIGALGVGIGYIGSFVGLGLGAWLLAADEARDAWVFAATGGAFLLFAIPAFLWVREPARRGERVTAAVVVASARASVAGIHQLLRGKELPHLRRFLLGRVLYADAANTMILFMGIYATAEVGFTDAGVRLVLLFGILGAAVLAPLWGRLVDRIGPKHTLDVVLLCWCFGLMVVMLMPILGLPKATFYPVAFILGGTLGGTWSADRPLLLSLAPADRIGEFYGIYAMVGRFAAIFGPLLWALIVDGLGWGRPAAVGSLLVLMVVAFAVFRGLPDPERPGPSPLASYLPWRAPDGRAPALPRAWPLRAPFLALYLLATSALFLAFAPRHGRVPVTEDHIRPFVYYISDLFTDVPKVLFNFVTGIWINYHPIQLVYVIVLVLLFGVWFEIREGTRRTLIVFYATSIVSGVSAGLLLHALRAVTSSDWIERAWTQPWTGGSAGAFGLMGALAARARRPWLLLVIFFVWEINVEAWYLRSYTPAFHLTALAAGYLIARRWMPPPPLPEPSRAAPRRMR